MKKIIMKQNEWLDYLWFRVVMATDVNENGCWIPNPERRKIYHIKYEKNDKDEEKCRNPSLLYFKWNGKGWERKYIQASHLTMIYLFGHPNKTAKREKRYCVFNGCCKEPKCVSPFHREWKTKTNCVPSTVKLVDETVDTVKLLAQHINENDEEVSVIEIKPTRIEEKSTKLIETTKDEQKSSKLVKQSSKTTDKIDDNKTKKQGTVGKLGTIKDLVSRNRVEKSFWS
ncbi:hypothetical protein ABK040_015863 [Willaertia magna]